MSRILVVVSTKKVGEVDLKTWQESVVCDNPNCYFAGGTGIHDYIYEIYPDSLGVVVRNGKDFCSERCYLSTPDGQARMELAGMNDSRPILNNP